MTLWHKFMLVGYVAIVSFSLALLLKYRRLDGARARYLRRQTIGLICATSLVPAGILLMDRISGVAWALLVLGLVAVSALLLLRS